MSHRCQSILTDSADMATISFNAPDGKEISEHSHPEDQLVFASEGVMTVHTTAGIWVIPPLRAVWIPAETPHSIVMSGAVSMRTLYLHPKLSRALPRRCFVVNVSPILRALILHACQFPRLSRRNPAERHIIEIVLDQLKAVDTIPLQLRHPADARALRIAQHLSANPGDQSTLEDLCERCGASKRTVQRLFLEETNMTFAKWRQQLRLLHSMRLLASGEKVSAAAGEAGYDSTSAFISMFRRQFGTTPTRYLADGSASR